MGYINSYKRLDNLCSDCGYVKGLSGYIEDMERRIDGAYRVPGWQEDYKNLKHYRWVRNRIAHDNDADEDNMCSEEDVAWIENFHQRILNGTDPLSVYRQRETTPKRPSYQSSSRPSYKSEYTSQQNSYRPSPSRNTMSPATGCAVSSLLGIIAAVVTLLFFFF